MSPFEARWFVFLVFGAISTLDLTYYDVFENVRIVVRSRRHDVVRAEISVWEILCNVEIRRASEGACEKRRRRLRGRAHLKSQSEHARAQDPYRNAENRKLLEMTNS